MMSPTGPVPNSSVSSEHSSAVAPVEEAQIPGGASSPSPSALLPSSALKQPGPEGTDPQCHTHLTLWESLWKELLITAGICSWVFLCETGTLNGNTFTSQSWCQAPAGRESPFMRSGCYFFIAFSVYIVNLFV